MGTRPEFTSAEVAAIAARRINDPDEEVRALAASCLTQARDRDRPEGTRPKPTGRIDY